ncbi:MAG: nucleotidyltransferase domain-containing protein [Defluviitaleaceae bacterium]|nr:nucleotidyltransferase domain-containing protein [Defluviitaleaceae bacterium]
MLYTVEEIKGRLTPIFEEKGVIRAVLFGSYAKGEATDESDIDIVAHVDKDMDILDFAEISGFVEDLLNKRVDFLYGGDTLSNAMKLEIERTGVTIFEKV